MEEGGGGAGYAVGISVLEPGSVLTAEDLLGRLSHAGDAVAVIAFEAAGALALRALPPQYPVAAAVECPADGADDGGRPQVWTDDRAAAPEATRSLLDPGPHTV